MKRNFLTGMVIIVVFVLVDLFIKKYITDNFETGKPIFSIKNFLVIAKVETHSMSFGWKKQVNYFSIVNIIFQLLFLIVFIRMLIRKTNNRSIIFSFMIIAGWAGNYFDKLFFSTSSSYQHLDYLSFTIVSDAFTNLSSLMNLLGWILLLLAVIFKFKDFKKIFERSKSLHQ